MSVSILIEKHSIIYSSNAFAKRIGLLNNNQYIGQLVFHSNNKLPLPLDSEKQVNGKPFYELNYILDDFANCVEILKSKKSKTLFFNGDGVAGENGINVNP